MKCLDLFCGAGGFTRGFVDAGFEVVCGIDIWPVAIRSVVRNCSHIALCKDLMEFSPQMLEDEIGRISFDVIIGGPPCQGHSMAGKRDTTDPRNGLFRAFVQYVAYFQPRAFMMENVMGILSSKLATGEKSVDVITDELSKCGYRVCILKLFASDFEVPQRRRRVVFFGIRSDLDINPCAPLETFSEIPVSTVLDDEYDPRLKLSERAVEGIRVRKERMRAEQKGFGAQILDLNRPSYTISARYWKDGYDALVPLSDGHFRRLSVMELKRIQSFPTNYILEGTKKEQIMQIGNAVAPRFAYHLARHLLKCLNE